MIRTTTNDIVIIGRFPPPYDGQALLTRRLETLLESKYDVHRISTSAPEGDEVAAEVKFRPERIRFYLQTLPVMRRKLREHPGAPVLWPSISPSLLGHWRDMIATLPAIQPEQPVIGISHRGNFHEVFESSITRPTALRLVRRLRAFVFNDGLSEACAPWIPAEKRIEIPNTIDDDLSCTPEEIYRKRESRMQRASLRLLFLSNMIPEKGYIDVLEAVKILRNRARPVTITYAGRWVDEEGRKKFESYVREHGLEDCVEHRGSVRDRAEIKRLHLESDVFLLPSYYPTEAQPLALIESLSAGTPVITTRHSGLPYMVQEGVQARFVPPRRPDAIAEAVESLLDKETWMHLSRGARKRFETHFSPDAVRKRWESLIEKCR